jgi:hypothetical protein
MTTAETIYVGKSRTGKRVHIVNEGGWGHCSRQIGNATPIQEARPPVDADWCRSCIGRAERTMVLAAELALARNESYGVPRMAGVPCPPVEAARWDGDSEIEIGEFILEHLERHPAPDGSETAAAWQRWGGQLVRSGNARLDILDGEAA